MTVEIILPNGLKTSTLTSNYKAEYDENLNLIDTHLGNIADPHGVTMAQVGLGVNAMDFSGVDPTGASDSYAGLQAAYDVANAADRPLYLPAGTYLIKTGLSAGGVGKWQIIGDGRRSSIIKAGAAITMLNCVRETSKSTSIVMQNVGMDGDDVASTGFDIKNVSFSIFNSLEIRNVNGNGLKAIGVEDLLFLGLEVRKCGNFASTLAAVDISQISGAGANSLAFLGGTIERSKYHGMQLTGAYAIKLLGMKLHGQIAGQDATTPNEFNLIDATDCRRLSIVGCQLALANSRSIRFAGTDDKSTLSAIGNSFFRTTNYQGTIQSETASISASSTSLTLSASGSWSDGASIRVTGAGASGVDLYTYIVSVDSTGTSLILADAASTTVSGATVFTVNAAYHIDAQRGHVHVDGNVFASQNASGNEHSSYAKTGGDIILGTNVARYTGTNIHEANPDTHVNRNGMSEYKMSNQIGNYYFWVDSTGALRLKSSTPTSDLDGSLV